MAASAAWKFTLDHEPAEVDLDPESARSWPHWEIDDAHSPILLHAVEHGVTPIARFRAIDAVADSG